MKRISIGLLVLAFAMAAVSADPPKDKQEKREQAREKANEKKNEAKDKKDEKKQGKKKKARAIARIEKRIAHLKQVAADLESKGNTEAAANVRKAIERAEAKLAEKKKKLGITDADVKEAESTPETPETPSGESK